MQHARTELRNCGAQAGEENMKLCGALTDERGGAELRPPAGQMFCFEKSHHLASRDASWIMRIINRNHLVLCAPKPGVATRETHRSIGFLLGRDARVSPGDETNARTNLLRLWCTHQGRRVCARAAGGNPFRSLAAVTNPISAMEPGRFQCRGEEELSNISRLFVCVCARA